MVILFIKKKYNKGIDFDKAVIRYTCYFMWAWEIIKTIRMVNYADYGPVGYYPLWMAPFHICSMGLYAFLIIGSKKDSKIAEWVKPFAFAVMMLVTSIILIIPGSSGILGTDPYWGFNFDNILPYQSFFYHGSILFVPLYMILSGFYRPKWFDIVKALVVLSVSAIFAQTLNYIFEGSGCDFMTLRYGNGNPFQFILQQSPFLYYLLIVSVIYSAVAIILSITILLQKLTNRKKAETVVVIE